MKRAVVPVLALAALAEAAHAQWLELSASMIAQQFATFVPPEPGDFPGIAGDRFAVTATILFDAGAPPVSADKNFVVFDVEHFRADVLALKAPGEPRFTLTPDNAAASIVYVVRDDTLLFSILEAERTFRLTIERPAGSFSGAMTSLPDAPADYAFDGTDNDEVSATYMRVSTAESVEAVWNPDDLYERGETVAYMVRQASPRDPEPCSAVDLATPFGVLNFSDVLAFLAAFGAGCP